MKVLRVKDVKDFTKILTKRGNNVLLPPVDADGNFILGLELLNDPVYEDLYEDILDLCELIEHDPLILEGLPDKPVKQKKDEFKAIRDVSPTLEDSVKAYYNSKKGLLAKGVDMVMSAGRAVVDFFTPST